MTPSTEKLKEEPEWTTYNKVEQPDWSYVASIIFIFVIVLSFIAAVVVTIISFWNALT